MPYLVVYYATEDHHENNKYASILADRFQRLARATQGVLTVHGAKNLAIDAENDNPANAFALEYNSSDENRNNDALLATLQDLIETFNDTIDHDKKPLTMTLEKIEPASFETGPLAEIKFKL